MRSVSNRFANLGLGKSKDTADRDGEGETSKTGQHSTNAPRERVSSHSEKSSTDFGKLIKSKAAHTSMLPSIIGSQTLRELQDFIAAEKGVMQSKRNLSDDISKASQALTTWGASEGSDLSDILSHASSILVHLSVAFNKYAEHEVVIRQLFKSIRTREEALEDLVKRRRSLGSRAEREEKKLAKMGQENKNLPSQTELLESLKSQMREMDTEIVNEQAKVGDFKRKVTKEALAFKFGGCLELAEKATIVGELGKLLIEEIPLEETPPGYGRAPYQGFEQTQRLSAEADRCISEVVFNPPRVVSLPPGLPHHAPLEPLASPTEGEKYEDYQRYAAFGDDPGSPSTSMAQQQNDGYEGTQHGYGHTNFVGDDMGTHNAKQQTGHHVMFAAPPDTPGFQKQDSYTSEDRAGPPVTTDLENMDYEYEQARQNANQDEEFDEAIRYASGAGAGAGAGGATTTTTDHHAQLQQAYNTPYGGHLQSQSYSPVTNDARDITPGTSGGYGLHPAADIHIPEPEHEVPPPQVVQEKPKIMDRGRSNRQFGDGPGDQASGGYNYGYDSSAFFVRNHASSPADLPKQEQVYPAQSHSPDQEEFTRAEAQRQIQRDREAIRINTASPGPQSSSRIGSPISSPGMGSRTFSAGAGSRTIAAGAFRRNKPTPAVAFGNSQERAESLESGNQVPPVSRPLPVATPFETPFETPQQGQENSYITSSDARAYNLPDLDIPLGAPLPPPTYMNSHSDATPDHEHTHGQAAGSSR